MGVITAPDPLIFTNKLSVFLAGSIEGDTAERWQDLIINNFKNAPITLLNPRREQWDNNWEQNINNPQFKQQVEWELSALEQSDMIILYFDKSTKSPISLLEMGLFAKSGKLVVCCPKGFWRKGNVDIVCERYGIKQVDNVQGLINEIEKRFENVLKFLN